MFEYDSNVGLGECFILSNRNFEVRFGTTLSDLQGQEEGVPEGSILSVTLFSININNLICNRSKHIHTIECQLQQCLNKIQKWALENGFKFSKTKTQDNYAFLSTSGSSQ